MAIEAIEHYLHDILAISIKNHGVSEGFVKQIIDTVGTQIYSCVRHWEDVPFRKALLLIGSEEGPFYEPAGKKDVKCFVVVTIRNSPLETIQSMDYEKAGLSSELSDRHIKTITGKAISYFNQLDFGELSKAVKEDSHFDLYADLAQRFPVAWTALQRAAGSVGKTTEYTKVRFERPFVLDGIATTSTKNNEMIKAVVDGYSLDIDPQLSTALYNVVSSEGLFAVDCFKMVSRNIEKLLKIMEFLLTHDRAFVTSNLYLENGYVERRIKPLRAATCRNGHREMLEHFSQTVGLGYKHAAALKNIYTLLKADTQENK